MSILQFYAGKQKHPLTRTRIILDNSQKINEQNKMHSVGLFDQPCTAAKNKDHQSCYAAHNSHQAKMSTCPNSDLFNEKTSCEKKTKIRYSLRGKKPTRRFLEFETTCQ